MDRVAARKVRMATMLVQSTVSLAIILLMNSAAYGGKLNAEDLKKKREGWFMTGLPLLNYTTDAGTGYGLKAFLFNNGTKTQTYFASSPYFVRLSGQFFQTTRGQAYHAIQADFPFLNGSKWRLRGEMVYGAVLNANYYGIGAKAADAGLRDAKGKSYPDTASYQSFLDSGTDDASLLKYNAYQRQRYYTRWTASRDVNDWFQIILGMEYSHSALRDWRGEEFVRDDKDYVSADTRFTRDKSQLIGRNGGWLNMLILGFKLDWRDFEPNPKEGVLGEYFLELSGKALGSDFKYTKQSASIRGYYTFFNLCQCNCSAYKAFFWKTA
ncbi:MAG TPA: hypothetical protein EYN06_10160 [Myxococcales bacterium]|nr:hypothetical protein [Myxococcales bacterium]